MIQNPIIHKREESAEPLYGKVVVSTDTQTIEIPVSRLCSKCVLIPMVINRTITELDTNYSGNTNLQISATNLPIVSANDFYFDGSMIKKTSTKVLISSIAGSNIVGTSYFEFSESKIKISYSLSADDVAKFSKGTYIYVAW